MRVNPDFTSQFRSDLEFYIPQLCSFYLRGDSEEPERLVSLLVLAGTSSFFFSHRMWFYFKSMILKSGVEITDDATLKNAKDVAKEQYKRTRVALNGIKEACCNENCQERLYLQNSQEIVALLTELKLLDRYPML